MADTSDGRIPPARVGHPDMAHEILARIVEDSGIERHLDQFDALGLEVIHGYLLVDTRLLSVAWDLLRE